MIIFFLLEGGRGFVFLTRSLLYLDICKEVGIYLLLVRYLYLDLSLTISTSAFLKFAGAFFLFIKKPKQTLTHTLRTRTLHVLLGKLGGREGKNNGFILSCLNFHLFH